MDDTADFTARAALDDDTPRFIRIAGNVCTPDDLVEEATAATGEKFKTLWGGPLAVLGTFIPIAKVFDFKKDDLYPAWQGMQYSHNMYSGQAKLEPLDNDRYPELQWTPLRETLAKGKPDFIE